MKRAAERGRWGTWLRQERLRRNLSTEQVRDLLAKRGYRVGESTYAEWESGYKKQPAREAQPHLIALFESEPPPEKTESYESADLAAALDRQTEAITLQTELLRELLRALRPAQDTDLRRLLLAADAEASTRPLRAAEGEPVPPDAGDVVGARRTP